MLMEHHVFRDGSGSCSRSLPTCSKRTPWQKLHLKLRSTTAGTCRNRSCSCRRNWTGLKLRYGESLSLVSCLLSLVRGPGLFCSKPEQGTDPFLGVLCNPGWFSVRLAVMRGLGGNSTAAFGACLFALLEVTVEDCAKVVFVH